ncbi:hypothetical protein Pmani_034592 [Petrolisthes manimaculis]|uniref:Uncharacterized protein n=1 Tax=Petrolisthes manimaculis TaxID=1843537 RepID=A0AAE1NM54_9EUCA|nr:hypothetical protein Pmani_034592 [Petrolisthes manimaculis]
MNEGEGEERRRREGEEKEKRRRREGEEKEKRRRREGEEKELRNGWEKEKGTSEGERDERMHGQSTLGDR